ncbi:MAG: FecR family protein [Myxococcales bacterium]|nr:FecR family protein [Myxococcales bacterium]
MSHDDPSEEARRRYLERSTPSAEALARLAATTRQAVWSPARRWRAPWILAVGASLVTAWWALRAEAPEVALSSLELPIEHVALDIEGTGTVAGTPQAPVIQWSSGRIEIAVEPERDVSLAVVTDEADVRVVGTRFDVERLHHATSVQVFAGRVQVTCAGEDTRELGPTEHVRCLPADLPGLLLRTVALTQASADPAQRLQTLDRAESMADVDGPTAAELLAHRVRATADAGDSDQAMQLARRYLDSGATTRRRELLTYLARTGFERQGCGARPDLEQAVDEGVDGVPQLLLARCLVEEDPERARRLADAAAVVPEVRDAPDWSRVADALLQALAP